MPKNLLELWLPKTVKDSIIVAPDDMISEARGNLWGYHLSIEQAELLSVVDVAFFAEQVMLSRGKWLLENKLPAMVIYWWHDEISCELRFSLVSKVHGKLPFGCKISVVDNLAKIAESWLESKILLSETGRDVVTDADNEEKQEYTDELTKQFVLEVFTANVPFRSTATKS